jgi:hypothetical protein
MPKDTKFNQSWLERTDNDGNQVHNWLKQGTTETTFQCCCIPYLNLINLYIVLVCHKNSIWYCHWGTSVRGANVFGEQVSLGSQCHWGAIVWGARFWIPVKSYLLKR